MCIEDPASKKNTNSSNLPLPSQRQHQVQVVAYLHGWDPSGRAGDFVWYDQSVDGFGRPGTPLKVAPPKSSKGKDKGRVLQFHSSTLECQRRYSNSATIQIYVKFRGISNRYLERHSDK